MLYSTKAMTYINVILQVFWLVQFLLKFILTVAGLLRIFTCIAHFSSTYDLVEQNNGAKINIIFEEHYNSELIFFKSVYKI